MSMITLPAAVVSRARDLFVLYSTKSAFKLEEYADVGAVYKRLSEAAQGEEPTEVSETDVKYIISAINVCAQRTPVEVQNYKPIVDLLETLAKSLQPAEEEEEEEETKTEL
ncbi:hypothetical protein Poli38472_006841 [Pythium oligandrum]|uniref:Uncharacterized protein n=1 Tax=Pythium oligandrum TaxID=41045 RepID=A0A8K1C5I4_PYTOL|nr:hypothetical protein Poli38472_006841 [Pythium oligandrum]|eukprot:TMW56831.1 hypothetical protein Poli38472_006841 [Pythium oligandrum]